MSREKVVAGLVVTVIEVAVAILVNQFTDDMRLQFAIPLVALVILLVTARTMVSWLESQESDDDRKEFVAALTEAVLPRPPSRQTVIDQAHSDARARREVRLLTSVPEPRIPAVLDWMSQHAGPDIDVPPGQLRVLVGPMGAGKSEIASRWWDQGLTEASRGDTAAVPLWIPARRLTDLRAQAKPVLAPAYGQARIVIDDLDSVTAQRAAEILDEARELVRAHPTVSILATSRPGIIPYPGEELVVEPWPAEKGADLAQLASGTELPWDFWAPETEKLLTSPLLALAVAARLDTGEEVKISRFALLSGLARLVVERRSKTTASADAWADLAQLARRILHDDSPVSASSFGNEAQIRRLTDTKLVVEHGGTLAFALPLFEQHFGAQWITTAPEGVESAAAPQAFPRWRYALAFAIATSDAAPAEQLMLRLARVNPAALSWVLDEIKTTDTTDENWVEGRSDAEVRDTLARLGASDLDPYTPLAVAAGKWLREAHTALIQGLEPIGSTLARSPRNGPARWGVRLQQGYLAIAESRDAHPNADIIELEEMWPGLGEWARTRQIFLSARPLARWNLFRNHFRDELDKHIRRRTLTVPHGCFLEAERVWFLCRIITKAKQWEAKPIPLAAIWDKLEPMTKQVRETVHSTWGTSSSQNIESDDVRWLESRLMTYTGEELASPWPAADAITHDAMHSYFRYSPELDLTVTSDVLRRAVVGYRHLVETAFPRFGDALGLYSMLPVKVTGLLIHGKPGHLDDGKRLYYSIQRLHDRDRTVDPEIDLKLATSKEAEVQLPMSWEAAEEREQRGTFHPSITAFGWAPSRADRRATNLAYRWVVRDLKSIGWATTEPHFYD